MKKIDISLKFMTHIVWGLVLEGLILAIMGLLIFVYPDLLGLLVGLALVVSGIMSLILALKVNKYSQFKVKL